MNTEKRRLSSIGVSLRSSAAMFLLAAAAGCGVTASTPCERAREEYRAGDYQAAASSYEACLAAAPDGPEAEEARFELAGVYQHNLKRYELACDSYRLFLERYPGSVHAAEARQHLAEAYVELGAGREAIAEYERLLEEHPETPERRKIRSTIADLYFQGKDYRQAELEYNRVVEGALYDELTEQAFLRLASIYHLMSNEDARAIPLYEQVAAATADPAVRRSALYSLSQVYADLFRYDEAIEVLRRVDDPKEAAYVAERTAELERQKKEHADAPEVDWTRGKGES